MNTLVMVGIALVALGIIGLIYGLMMKMRAGRVTDAPFVKTGEAAQKGTAAANPKGMISAEGNVECPQPIVSPVSNTTCLFFEIKVTAEWKDGDTTKTKELSKEKQAARFAINDGTGPVWVDAREGGDFEPEQNKTETKSTGLIGGITGQDLVFGNYRISPGILNMGTKYRVEEKVLPAVPRLYVCGKVGSSNEIGSPSWRQLLMSGKGRDEYLSHATKQAKLFLIGGGAMFGVGLITGVAIPAIAGGDEKPKAKVAASASASASAVPADTAAASGSATNMPAGTGANKSPGPGPAKAPPAGKTPPTKKK
jgi:hypothetical protein